MTCSDIVNSLAENPASRLDPEAREHLDRWPACRQLVAAVRPSRSDTGRSSAHLRAIERQFVNDLRPVRRIAARRYLV